jgi:tetratricopeptide (TPR) repeat protein
MGFRIRRSIQIVPGIRMTFSKTGIGYSAGVKGYRITKRADGRVQRTASIPGTGLSYVTTSGSARTRGATRPRVAPAPSTAAATHPVRPGLFAPHGEKELFTALQHHDVDAMERVVQEGPPFAVAAATMAGLMKMESGDQDRARELLAWVFASGTDPAAEEFMRKYPTMLVTLTIVPGVEVELPPDRTTVGLALAELYQDAHQLDAAIETVEHVEPTSYAALSLAELYCDAARWQDLIEVTDDVTNQDDATAFLCTMRGVALREEGHFDAARDAFKEALKSKKREPVVRHRALLERARGYEAEGKRALARKDLELILSEDSTYPGLQEALTELGA